jgi:hypothetical protein
LFDSKNLYLAATEWIRGWKRSNWIKKTDSKPVMNKDLMMRIDELQQKLKLKWVFYTQNFYMYIIFLFRHMYPVIHQIKEMMKLIV